MEKVTPINSADPQDLLASVLKDVSRSFYRTLQILPGPVRRQISLAYLLARTSDTIADSGRVPVPARLGALEDFRRRVSGDPGFPLELESICSDETPASERILLRRAEESISILNEFEAADIALIRKVLDTITTGQMQDLERFSTDSPSGKSEASASNIQSLQTAKELDDYTYMVAGCVGEFWTKMCRAHLFPNARLEEDALIRDGIRFGKGLQLVNILRDLPSDLRSGRCYIPQAQLSEAGLSPKDLLAKESYEKFRSLYHEWLRLAEDHLQAGWRYTNALPWTQVRVRLACAWPLLIGFETLKILREGNVLDHSKRLKVSRKWVRNMIVRSMLLYPVPGVWRRLA